MSNLSSEEISAIARETAQNLTAEYKQLWIDRETHYHDHIWIAEQKRRQEDWAAFKRKIISSAAIWALILLLGFIGMSTWQSVIGAAKAAMQTNGG